MTNYIIGNPFENIKVILNTLIGSPRYHYKPDTENQKMIAHNEFNDNVFSVQKGTIIIDRAYAEDILSPKVLSDYKEYGKLFFNYGSSLLNMLVAILVKRDYAGAAILLSEDRFAIHKMAVAYNRFINDFDDLIKLDKEETNLVFVDLINKIDNIYQRTMESEDAYCETGELLSLLYGALTIYLSGVLINITDKIGVSIESLYTDETDRNIEILSNNIISANSLDNDVKYKFISISYLYYLMTEFYNRNCGCSFVTKINKPFYKIGEKISTIDISTVEDELDISFLTQSELNTKDKDSFLNLLSPVSVIKEPSIFDSLLRKYDSSDFAGIASYMGLYIENPKKEKPVLEAVLESDKIDSGTVDVLYNHFVDTVANAIPKDISPRYFYRVSAYAAAFRKIKNENISKEITECASLGMYQAEAILVLLYKSWIVCKGYYRNISTGVYIKNPLRAAQDVKVKSIINRIITAYSEYVNKDELPDNNVVISIMNDENYKIDNVDLLLDITNTNDPFIFNTSKLPYVSEFSSEKYDEIVKALNENRISFIEFFVYCHNVNEKPFDAKYMNEVIEMDYEQKTMDLLSKLAFDKCDYNLIYSSKLGNILGSIIGSVVKNEKTDDRFTMYFNTFIKNTIPLLMAKSLIDLDSENDEDIFGNTNKENDNILPNLKSQRLFNFMSK